MALKLEPDLESVSAQASDAVNKWMCDVHPIKQMTDVQNVQTQIQYCSKPHLHSIIDRLVTANDKKEATRQIENNNKKNTNRIPKYLLIEIETLGRLYRDITGSHFGR